MDWVCITPCHCKTLCITAQHAFPLHRLEKNKSHQTLDALLMAVKQYAMCREEKWYSIFKCGDSRGAPPPGWALGDAFDHGDA